MLILELVFEHRFCSLDLGVVHVEGLLCPTDTYSNGNAFDAKYEFMSKYCLLGKEREINRNNGIRREAGRGSGRLEKATLQRARGGH